MPSPSRRTGSEDTMATNHERIELSSELLAMLLAAYCNGCEGCGCCEIRSLCDEAFGKQSGCSERDWLDWLQEECDE